MASKSPKKTQNKPALNTRAVQGHTTSTRLVEHKTAQQVMYAGPIPPPEILAELKKIHPESVDIVLKIAEREQNNHIRESEERHTRLMKAMEFEHTENMYALWLAFFACAAFLGAGVFLALHGSQIAGSLLAGTSIVGIVGSFLKNIGKERKTKLPTPSQSPKES